MADKLRQILIKDTGLFATQFTVVDKGDAVEAIGIEDRGIATGTNWFLETNINATQCNFIAFTEQVIDIQGLDYSAISALSENIIQSESPSIYTKTDGFIRDYMILSTKRLNRADLTDRIQLNQNPLPFDEYRPSALGGSGDLQALMTRDQVFTGRAQFYSNDVVSSPVNGFKRLQTNTSLNMGNVLSCAQLFYYRVVFGQGDHSNIGTSTFMDLSPRTTIVSFTQLDLDENAEVQAMIKAYQAPSGTE